MEGGREGGREGEREREREREKEGGRERERGRERETERAATMMMLSELYEDPSRRVSPLNLSSVNPQLNS